MKIPFFVIHGNHDDPTVFVEVVLIGRVGCLCWIY